MIHRCSAWSQPLDLEPLSPALSLARTSLDHTATKLSDVPDLLLRRRRKKKYLDIKDNRQDNAAWPHPPLRISPIREINSPTKPALDTLGSSSTHPPQVRSRGKWPCRKEHPNLAEVAMAQEDVAAVVAEEALEVAPEVVADEEAGPPGERMRFVMVAETRIRLQVLQERRPIKLLTAERLGLRGRSCRSSRLRLRRRKSRTTMPMCASSVRIPWRTIPWLLVITLPAISAACG